MAYALPLSENMFGKMRGRFDEAAARQIQRSLVDECFYRFMALADEDRREVAARIEGVFGPRRDGWVLKEKRGDRTE